MDMDKIKVLSSLFFVLFFSLVFAQKKIPVIKSNTQNVTIIEDGLSKTDWSLNPSLKPDVYATGKVVKKKSVKLITDIDSISVMLRPSEKFDFVVLYKGKDSCHTRFQSPEKRNFDFKVSKNDTIPFTFTEKNNIQFKVLFNKRDTLNLVFDTGASGFHLTREQIKKYFNPDGKKEKILMSDINDNEFKIGHLLCEHQQIYPTSEAPFGSSGVVGWDVFDEKIVEINYDKNIIIIHNNALKISRDYQRMDLRFIREHFFLTTQLEIGNQKFKNIFLFDTGYQRTVLLDKDLVNEQHYPKDKLPVIKKTTLKNSLNENVNVVTLLNERLRLGKYTLHNVPVQLLSSSNPLGFKSHFLGNEVLKRFNTILDFKKNVAYFKPSKYFDAKYAEKR